MIESNNMKLSFTNFDNIRLNNDNNNNKNNNIIILIITIMKKW